MNARDFKRKLTAVFIADVAGYSRLMGEDETATVKTLEDYKEVMSSLIKQHRGRVIDSPGDNVLAEFASVVDAVQCGVAVQNELKARNADLPENRRMQFRIGINLGDVIEEGDRIYGDGVNIAARLESCADPGGICVSKTAFDHIETKLPLGYEYLGEKEVKNIAKPVGAYKVLMEPRVVVTGLKEKKPSVSLWRRKGILAGAVGLLVLIIGVAAWNFYFRPPSIEPASVEKMAFPLPDKPSIAVLPFVNMSGDPQQEFFSDGITEDIIAALSKVPNLFVIARNSTFTYKDKPVKVQQVAEDLGIRYVLEGSIQKAGDRVRITAQLIDAINGYHVWSERYDREMKDIFALQDEITLKTLRAIDAKLTHGYSGPLPGKGMDNLEAYLKLLQFREVVKEFNKESNFKARQLAEEVIRLDQQSARGYHALAAVNVLDVLLGISTSPIESLIKGIRLCKKAISLDDSYAMAHEQLCGCYTMIGEHEKGIAEGELAIKLAPNWPDAYANLVHSLFFAGRPEEALPYIETGLRLDPLGASIWLCQGAANTYALIGRHEDAIKMAKLILSCRPNNVFAQVTLAVNYAALGRDDEAHAAAQDIVRIDPTFSAQRYSRNLPFKDPNRRVRTIELLRKAGLPD